MQIENFLDRLDRVRQSDAFTIHLKRESHTQLRQVAERLGLGESEVARRALSLGLKRFERVTLPGSQAQGIED